ncbi:MAG: hypothetical protein GYA14_17555, partial [Ignavibacteria bacterium]|nr:hypothetical protein [Ignavibacteria bacterium]
MVDSKIVCCYLLPITKYGYPPKAENTLDYIKEMYSLGFSSVEIEGIRETHLTKVFEMRFEIKKMIDGWRYSDAFSAITEKLNSKDKLSDAEKKALYINLAVVLKMLGKPADALSNIKLAHELNASSEVCLYYLSLLSLSVSDIAAASSYAGKLKEISPENPWAYLMSASIFAFEGRARKAYDEIKKAIKLERDFFEARAFLFSYYKKRKKYESARDELKKLMKLTPNFELAPFFTAAGFADRKAASEKVKSE